MCRVVHACSVAGEFRFVELIYRLLVLFTQAMTMSDTFDQHRAPRITSLSPDLFQRRYTTLSTTVGVHSTSLELIAAAFEPGRLTGVFCNRTLSIVIASTYNITCLRSIR